MRSLQTRTALLLLAAGVFLAYGLSLAREDPSRRVREARLKVLGEAAKDHALDSQGKLPADVRTLADEGYVVAPDVVERLDAYALASPTWREGEVVPLVREVDPVEGVVLSFYSDGSIRSVETPPSSTPPASSPPSRALGLELAEQGGGLVVKRVASSPLAEQGVRPGDVLVVFDDAERVELRSVGTLAEYESRLAETTGAATWILIFERGGAELVMTVEREGGGAMPSPAAAAPTALVARLKSADPEVRQSAAYGLAALGPDGLPHLGALETCLADPDPAVRRAVVQAVHDICFEAGAYTRALTALDRGAQDARVENRIEAVISVLMIFEELEGSALRRAEAILQRAAKDPDPQVREIATSR